VEVRETLRARVEDVTQTGEARRLVTSLCRDLGFSELDIGRVSLVVTEAATNLVRHARGGELLFRPLELAGKTGLEILSLDRGPGMSNPARSLRDGYSTAGSPGTGLGALGRASSSFDLFSELETGTVLACRYWPSPPGDVPFRPLETGVVCLSMTEGEPCGDTWAVAPGASKSSVLVCDGLGHGLLAAEASRLAERLFRELRPRGPAETVEALHQGLRGTRGAALAVLEADHSNGVVRYCGVGNIGARIVEGESERHMVSYGGIVGQEVRKMQVQLPVAGGCPPRPPLRRPRHLLAPLLPPRPREPPPVGRRRRAREGFPARQGRHDGPRGPTARPSRGPDRARRRDRVSLPIVTVELRFEHDVVLVRQRARTIAGLLGFVHIDQTRIALPYQNHLLQLTSRTGMGMGIAGARRLVDSFDVQSRAGEGTAVVLAKAVPAGAPPVTLALIAKITGELGRRSPEDPFEEIQLQNQELLGAMNELRRRQEELEALNPQLEVRIGGWWPFSPSSTRTPRA
jgi:anti-sigma regulatory factor (Ser/Thr protein kinase)